MRAREIDEGRLRRGLAIVLALVLTAAVVPLAGPAGAAGTFSDDDGNVHEGAIEEIAVLGITRGCNPPTNNLYCPGDVVTRGQMAAFLVRTFDFTAGGNSQFSDTSGNVFANDIDKLAAAGITKGCNPPANTRFCPDDAVTRGQMAAFLVRALELNDLSATPFTDTAGSIFATDISRLAAAGITRGCNPPTNSRFCPGDPVLRDQMATFLSRAHDIFTTGTTTTTTTVNTTPTSPPTTSSTTQPPSTFTCPAPVIDLGTARPSAAAEAAEQLRVASGANRTESRLLEGARLSGNTYIYVADGPGIQEVRFWVDDTSRSGEPNQTEPNAPWDFGGTADGAGIPVNTAAEPGLLDNGTHTVTVEIDKGGSPIVKTATFTVDNSAPTADDPDQIHLSWTANTATTMTVKWRTDSASAPSVVRYCRPGDSSWTTATAGTKQSIPGSGTFHTSTITGLSPATTYRFQVRGSATGSWSATKTFQTAPGATGSFDAVYFADTGLVGRLDGLGVGPLESVNAMALINPDLLLPGGDYAYNATGACDASDGRFETGSLNGNDPGELDLAIDHWFRQTSPLLDHIPAMPTYGNHEVLLCEGFDIWADRFATPTGIGGGNPGVNGNGHDPRATDDRSNYSFDVGPVHFISILAIYESTALTTDQLTWLEADIEDAEDSGAEWIVPYFHATPISHGDNHSTNNALRNQLADLFEDHDIRVAIFSHDQSYERTYPLTDLSGGNPTIADDDESCYSDGNGVIWVKVSPAGKHSNKSGSFSPWIANPGWVAVRNNDLHHFLHLEASPNALDFTTYGLDGVGSAAVVVDDFTIQEASC